MILDELLIKLGVEVSADELAAFEAKLEALGDRAGQFADQFEQAIDDIAPELNELEQVISESIGAAMQQSGATAETVVQALEADLASMGLTFEDLGLTAETVGDALVQSLEETESAEQELVQTSDKLKSAVEKQTNSTEENTEANQENKESIDGLSGSVLGFILSAIGLGKAKDEFDKVGKSAEGLSKKLGLVSLAVGAAVAGMVMFVDQALTALDDIHQLSNVTGESTDYIYTLGKVAETTGSSVEAAQASIAGLSKVIGEAAAGVGRGAKTFEQYGLSAKDAEGNVKQASDVLEELREKMVDMSQQEKIAMLAKMGIDDSMIQVLMQSKEDFDAAMAENKAMTLGVGTKEDAATAAEFKDILADLFKMLKAVSEVIALRLAPHIGELIGRFKDWFIANAELIKGGLSLLGDILGVVFDFIGAVANAIDGIIRHTIGWKAALYILGAALIWIKRQMLLAFATNPITWVVLAIVGLIALIDDFITYLDGGESALGEFWEPFKQALLWVKAKWQAFLDEFSIDPIGAVLGLLFDVMTLPFKTAIEFIVGLWNKLIGQDISLDGFYKTLSGVKDLFINAFRPAFEWLIDMWNNVATFFGKEPIKFDVQTNNTEGTGIVGANDVPAGSTPMLDPSATAKTGATNQQMQDNSQKNSNNKITVNNTYNTTSTEQATAAANAAMRTVENTFSPITM